MKIEGILEYLEELTEEERNDVFQEIKDKFCMQCGGREPCYCLHDYINAD